MENERRKVVVSRPRFRPETRNKHFGMRDGFNRGDFGNGNRITFGNRSRLLTTTASATAAPRRHQRQRTTEQPPEFCIRQPPKQHAHHSEPTA